MIRILLVTHGPMAESMRESARMFFGDKSDELHTMGLYPNDNPEDLKERIIKVVELNDVGDGFLILVDIFYGTPFNMTALAIDELKEKHKVQCFTGVNLPILIETLASTESMSLEDLTKHIEGMSMQTIVNLRSTLDL